MEDILLSYLADHPESDPQDLIKLLYQMEFGCEHIVKNADTARRNLESELSVLGKPLPGEGLYEPIGEGLCRLNLRPASSKLTADEILSLFLDCATSSAGTKTGFLNRIETLIRLCEDERISFDPIEIEIFMAGYDRHRCTPVHHSVRYHEAYQPAYRVVRQYQLRQLLKTKRR